LAKALILGDLHLGKNLNFGKNLIGGTTYNSRLGDQLNILDWVLQLCSAEQIYHVIITGDIFEEPKPNFQIIKEFLKWINKCGDLAINVHVIYGNHDILRNGQFITSPLDIYEESEKENLFLYKNIETFHLDEMSFTLIPFTDYKTLQVSKNEEANNIIKQKLVFELGETPPFYTKIVIGHLALEGSMWVGDEVEGISNEIFVTPSTLNGFDLIWMGHVHKLQDFKWPGFKHVAHIGSADISDFGEEKHTKKVVIIDNGNFKYVEIPNRKFFSIAKDILESDKDPTGIIKKEIEDNKESIKNSIVKIEINNSSLQSLDKKEIQDLVYKLGAFHLYKIVEHKKISSPLLQKKTTLEFKTEISENEAINKWAEKFIDKDKRTDFIELCADIMKQDK